MAKSTKTSGSQPGALPIKLFASAHAWQRWLQAEHARSPGVWLKFAKRGHAAATVSYAEALEVALCFGWIDGQKNKLDAEFWLQKFTPRAARSRWSQINCAKALGLIESGRMQPAGLKAVEQAQADGRWAAAYSSQSRAQVSPDLQRALDAQPAAREFFATLDSRNRYSILYRIQDAKKPETRARRIAAFVEMLAQGKTLYP
jgi:uncharacterized protein YdeI (YjbR/CyaY-like superfamily)